MGDESFLKCSEHHERLWKRSLSSNSGISCFLARVLLDFRQTCYETQKHKDQFLSALFGNNFENVCGERARETAVDFRSWDTWPSYIERFIVLECGARWYAIEKEEKLPACARRERREEAP